MIWLDDLDGDEARDILVGGCDSHFHGPIYREGAVWILSGSDGSVIWRTTVDEVLAE